MTQPEPDFIDALHLHPHRPSNAESLWRHLASIARDPQDLAGIANVFFDCASRGQMIEVLVAWAARVTARVPSPPQERNAKRQADIEAKTERHIFDVKLPNGKRVAENTFGYVASCGGALTRLGNAGAADAVVGDTLTREQGAAIYAGQLS
jgi:hypothetical protein